MSAAAMNQPPAPPDLDTARAAIRRAGEPTGGLLRHEEYEALHQALATAVNTLIPPVQARTDRLWRGTTEWFERARCITDARTALERGLGPGLLSARTHVELLAQHCAELCDLYEKDTAAAGTAAGTAAGGPRTPQDPDHGQALGHTTTNQKGRHQPMMNAILRAAGGDDDEPGDDDPTPPGRYPGDSDDGRQYNH